MKNGLTDEGQANIATSYKRLLFSCVTVLTLDKGGISELHLCLKGTMSAMFLKDLALKTYRGLKGRIKRAKQLVVFAVNSTWLLLPSLVQMTAW